MVDDATSRHLINRLNTESQKDRMQTLMFNIAMNVYYLLMTLTIVGLYNNPYYVTIISDLIKLYMSCYIIWKFNPYRKNIVFTRLDMNIIYGCSVSLLFSLLVNTIVMQYFDTIRSYIRNIVGSKQSYAV